MNHKPIDYGTWDRSGIGINIDSLLNSEEREIWESAWPYQGKRKDPEHTEIVTYFGFKLLEHLEGNRNVVIPAAILHDTGWGLMPKERTALFMQENWREYETELRKEHQEAGKNFALGLLIGMKYPLEHREHSVEIISQHDTRKGFYSLEDGIVRDADKLWRFTLFGIEIATKTRWSIRLEKFSAIAFVSEYIVNGFGGKSSVTFSSFLIPKMLLLEA